MGRTGLGFLRMQWQDVSVLQAEARPSPLPALQLQRSWLQLVCSRPGSTPHEWRAHWMVLQCVTASQQRLRTLIWICVSTVFCFSNHFTPCSLLMGACLLVSLLAWLCFPFCYIQDGVPICTAVNFSSSRKLVALQPFPPCQSGRGEIQEEDVPQLSIFWVATTLLVAGHWRVALPTLRLSLTVRWLFCYLCRVE